jgi:hypothetical protein
MEIKPETWRKKKKFNLEIGKSLGSGNSEGSGRAGVLQIWKLRMQVSSTMKGERDLGNMFSKYSYLTKVKMVSIVMTAGLR